MEFSYILNAVKRYWWVVLACVVLGTAVGFTRAKPAVYVSSATLSVDPSGPGLSGRSESPDRLFATEVSAMTSEGFAADVSKLAGSRIPARDLQGMVTVTNRPDTDLLDIMVKTSDAARAQSIVHNYVVVYLARLRAEAAEQRRAVTEQFDTQLEAISQRLARASDPNQRQALLAQYSQLSADKAAAEVAAATAGTTQVIEPGTDPIMSAQGKVKTYAPWIGLGLLAGIFAAVVLARLSRRVLDAEEVEEILGRPIVGELPNNLAVTASRGAWWKASPETATFLDELCTRIESCDRRGDGLTVLVAETEPAGSAPLLAHAIAARLGRWGLAVAFGNADTSAGGLVAQFGTPTLTVPEVVAAKGAVDVPRPSPPRLTYVDMSDPIDVATMHRVGPANVLSTLSEGHDVVVVATGALLEARTAAKFAPIVDVVVVVVPVQRQTRRRLEMIAQQLSDSRGPVLIVADREAPKSNGDHAAKRDAQGGTKMEFQRTIAPPTSGIGGR